MGKPIDKQYLIDNMRTFKSVILDPNYIIQRQVLPQATADNLGTVFQYIGSDSTNYTIGGFYQSQQVAGSDPATYHWVEITTRTNIDGTTILENSNKEIYVPKATASSLGVISAGDGTSVDANGELTVVDRIKVVSVMPTAAAALEDEVVIYMGATTASYNNGGIYTCVSDGQDPATYSWELCSGNTFDDNDFDVSSTGEVSLDPSQKVFDGTVDEYEALSASEQKKYGYIASPDEVSEDIADEVTDGDMRPVTSNAVYDAFNTIESGNAVGRTGYLTSESSIKYYKVGHIVTVEFNITFESAVAADTWFAENLPTNGNVSHIMDFTIYNVTNKEVALVHIINGRVYTRFNIANETRYIGGFTYICQ